MAETREDRRRCAQRRRAAPPPVAAAHHNSPSMHGAVPVFLGPGSTKIRAQIGQGRHLLPKVTRRPPRPARKPLLLFARACASRSQTHPHGPRARHCSPAPARKAPNLARCASHQHETAGGTCGGVRIFGCSGRVQCSSMAYHESHP